MASAQVLPSSRKQEHLEAGKRRLEEFRKKKAAEQAKKASSTNQINSSDVSSIEKCPVETEIVRATVADGAGTSNGPSGAVSETSVLSNNDIGVVDFSQKKEQASSNDTRSSPSTYDFNTAPADKVQKHVGDQEYKTYGILGFGGQIDDNHSHEKEGMHNDFQKYTGTLNGTTFDQSIALRRQASQDVSTGPTGPTSSSLFGDLIEPSTTIRGYAHEIGKKTYGTGVEVNDPMTFRFGEGKMSSSASGFSNGLSAPMPTSESMGFGSDDRSSSNHSSLYSLTPETNSRRSRPSFLDSLNVSKASPGSVFQQAESQESFMSNSTSVNGMNPLGSLSFLKPSTVDDTVRPFSMFETSGPHGFSHSVKGNSVEKQHDFYSSNQNEDFSALEQHIEDLTQEKFSLQRTLDASRALAESLASENSSLTESYNQQRIVVDQLKSDMESIQEEIKAQLVELEAVRHEYANAQLECNAADERAKLLASEVIGLEEKALRLRSSELKLERQLENSHAEIASYKKKLSSIEKDRSDLQSTINALQEEKKLLQSMLRKASTSERKVDASKSTTNNKDVSTSTEDLANEDAIPGTINHERDNAASSLSLPASGQSIFDVSSVNLPPDQMQTIENINTLISELALEKEELIQSLATESSQCSKLKELNYELSRKLEAQTQRLELLTAQSMANENIIVRQPTPDTQDNVPYADEGDEVVERVLGWIMKLFPGGPSRRRTSKLL